MRGYQRDCVKDRARWRAEVSALRRERGWRARSRLGELLRLDPRHAREAVAVQRAALRLVRDDPRGAAVARLRLAVALQYAGRHVEALRWFDRAERTVRERRLPRLRDFVAQHRGKCLAELGRFDEARAEFRDALRLRSRRRRPVRSLVASTKRALAGLP